MFKHNQKVIIVLDRRASFSSSDVTLGKPYAATYIEPFGVYTFNGDVKRSNAYGGVKLVDDVGDEVVLCININPTMEITACL
jgi:hypothetical protein